MGIKAAFWKPHLDGWRDSGLRNEVEPERCQVH